MLAQKEWPFEIDGQHFVPKLFRRLFERGARIDAGVVHEHVKAAELANSRFYGTPAMILNPYVGRLKLSRSTAAQYLTSDILATPRFEICQHNTRTFRSQPQGNDPVWNDEHCRNKRILIDDTTRNALLSEKPATLATYRMELGEKNIPVKNVFVPLWIKGRRWGNFELAYRDD